MRKIEEEMIYAISNKINMYKSNTIVENVDNVIIVKLHGNTIAKIDEDYCNLTISDCSWKTNTTKSRLNAILYHFNLPCIRQKKGSWYIDDNIFESNESFRIFK